MEIVTGSTGEVHVTPIDDAVRNGNIGYLSDKVVFTCFRNFEAAAITANEVRVYGGYGMNQGRYFKINEDEWDSVTIENGASGYKRADLIVARYTMNTQTGFEDISLAVIKGASGNSYVDPSYVTGDINSGDTQDDFPLYRVRLNGLTIAGIDQLFTLLPDGGRIGELEAKLQSHINEFNALNIRANLASESTAYLKNGANVRPGVEGVLPANHGGTGNSTLNASANALDNALDVSGTTPADDSYYIGTTPGSNSVFNRKPFSALWDYIRNKVRGLLGMDATDVVPIAHGGTGRTIFTQGKVPVGNISGGLDEIGIDTAPSGSSNNLITSKGVADALGSAGYGDMLKSTYDPNEDGIIDASQGGTGQTSLQATRNAMGLGNTTGALPIANGGTGAATAALARNNLGLGNTTGALPIANGGTGATTAAAARTNLGAAATTQLTDGSVTKVGTANKGNVNTPIYLNAGTPTECYSFVPTVGGTFTGQVKIDKNRLWLVANGGVSPLFIDATSLGSVHIEVDGLRKSNLHQWLANSSGTFQVSGASSRRVKENIKKMSKERAKKLLDIDIVSFDYIGSHGNGMKDQCGVIAEDTINIIPEAVIIHQNYDENKPVSETNPSPEVDYRQFIPYLIKLVQMQQEEIDELKKALT